MEYAIGMLVVWTLWIISGWNFCLGIRVPKERRRWYRFGIHGGLKFWLLFAGRNRKSTFTLMKNKKNKPVGVWIDEGPHQLDRSLLYGMDFGKTCTTVEVTFDNGKVVDIKEK